MMKSILVTGGAGYIGSHTVKALLDVDYDVHVLDNLVTGSREAVDKRAHFKQLNVYDEVALKDYLENHPIDAVLHCAGEIVVSESVENPSKYFAANVAGMNHVLKVLSEVGIDKIIFSSTASVYGNNCIDKPANEDTLLNPINPYAETKLMGERMIYWMANRYNWKYVIFRYFNVAGAAMDASNGLRVKNPTHIIPNINKTALGQNDSLKIFGDDYETRDGSCVRDYIHVLDLAQVHVKGFDYLFTDSSTSQIFNLGTEHGYTVKEIYNTAEQILHQKIPYEIVARRAGDPASVLANASKAKEFLNWQAYYSLKDIILSDYNWRMKAGNSLVD
ncbi:UDP-glucose 4-epimerase GalE [Streptococcus intermedius]|nr:UDP-glucose 4-epimerase GalE [Streptococcus intermedius]